jgi:hypothetical protein
MINFAPQLLFIMTFTPSQKNKLAKISACYRRIEKIALEGNLDLDYFTMSFKSTNLVFKRQEEEEQRILSGERKSIFEQSEKNQAEYNPDLKSNSID